MMLSRYKAIPHSNLEKAVIEFYRRVNAVYPREDGGNAAEIARNSASMTERYLHENGFTGLRVPLKSFRSWDKPTQEKIRQIIHSGSPIVMHTANASSRATRGKDGLTHVMVAVGYAKGGLWFYDPGGNFVKGNDRGPNRYFHPTSGKLAFYSWDFIRKNQIGRNYYYVSKR